MFIHISLHRILSFGQNNYDSVLIYQKTRLTRDILYLFVLTTID